MVSLCFYCTLIFGSDGQPAHENACPTRVIDDLRSRVRELEEGLGRIAEWPVGDALYAVKEMRAIAAHALLTTPTKAVPQWEKDEDWG